MTTHYDYEIQPHELRAISKGSRGSCPVCGGRDCFVMYTNGPKCFKCDNKSELRKHFWGYSFTPGRQDLSPEAITAREKKLDKVWLASLPVTAADLVDTYLESRGIKITSFPKDIAFHPSLEYWHQFKEDEPSKFVGSFPCMLAVIRDVSGKAVNLHRTYLASNGKAKADVPGKSKKLMSFTYTNAGLGAAIRLAEPSEVLIISEGIENALSAHLITGKPAWAARDSGSLARWTPPDVVREVWIAADHDKSGMKAANQLAIRLQSRGLVVKISMPPQPGEDWNDYLRNGNY